MSETTISLRQQIATADQLQSVVRSMKALAASSLGQYRKAVGALDDYALTTRLALRACVANVALPTALAAGAACAPVRIDAVVFGSDQGMVGRFNDDMCDFVCTALAPLAGDKFIWAVGERIAARCQDAGMTLAQVFVLPMAVGAIAPLIGRLLLALDAQRPLELAQPVEVFYHRARLHAAGGPMRQQLLPLDAAWWRAAAATPWPTPARPELLGSVDATLAGCIRQFLFVSLFRACADSQASEHASRLAAMERAEKNIEDLLGDLGGRYQRLRQDGIDEELFDLIAGFEALRAVPGRPRRGPDQRPPRCRLQAPPS